jgi:predicted component of type VI protein secretion system
MRETKLVLLAAIEAVRDAVTGFDDRLQRGQVAAEQRRGIDEEGLAFRMRRRGNRGGTEQAVGEVLAIGRGQRRVRVHAHARVLRQQL